MKTVQFPLTITQSGVSARIRKSSQTKNGGAYATYIIEYSLLGQRKRESRTNLAEAKKAAVDACQRIANGDHLVLELTSTDRLAYLRATEALNPIRVPIDTACRDYADAFQILGNCGSLVDAARLMAQQRRGVVSKSVPEAVEELIAQTETEQRNTTNATRRKDAWLKILEAHLRGKLARDFNCSVSDLSSAILEPWLIGLKNSERTRCNIRDCVGYFLRWCRGRNYLSKDADPLANVQKFRKRKRGAVKIITDDELVLLLAHASEDLHPVSRAASLRWSARF